MLACLGSKTPAVQSDGPSKHQKIYWNFFRQVATLNSLTNENQQMHNLLTLRNCTWQTFSKTPQKAVDNLPLVQGDYLRCSQPQVDITVLVSTGGWVQHEWSPCRLLASPHVTMCISSPLLLLILDLLLEEDSVLQEVCGVGHPPGGLPLAGAHHAQPILGLGVRGAQLSPVRE